MIDPKIKIRNSTEVSSYLQDESHLGKGMAEAVYFPADEREVSALLADCQRTGTAVTVAGSRTGVVGGAVPHGGVVIAMEKMNRILGIKKYHQEERSQEEKSQKKGCQEEGWLIQVEPGVILQDLQRRVETKDFEKICECPREFLADSALYFYPPDPTEGTATLGGNVAANSSGARSMAYGPTRDYVQRLRVVLPAGEVLDIPRGKYLSDSSGIMEFQNKKIQIPAYRMPEVKNAAGYYARPGMDLIDLFIGAEGTLGVITCMELKIVPRPKNIFSGIAFFPDAKKAFQFARQVSARPSDPLSRLRPIVLEYFNDHSLELLRQKRQADGQGSSIPEFPLYARGAIFFEQFYQEEEELEELYEHWQAALEAGGVNMDDTWGGFGECELEKMKNFRHALPDILNEIFRERKRQYPNIHKISADIAVPASALDEMVSFYQTGSEGLEYVLFGHIGECHLHLNLLPGTAEEMTRAEDLSLEFAQKAVSLGGTISAEHGIGKMKHRLLEMLYGREGIREMIRIKLLLDPKGILNRGNIFPEHYLPSLD